MSSINWQNLFGCVIEKIHQQHPQIRKSYVGEIKIYLNDTEPKMLPWKFGCIYRVRFGHIIVQSINKISHDPLSNLKVTEIKEVHVKE